MLFRSKNDAQSPANADDLNIEVRKKIEHQRHISKCLPKRIRAESFRYDVNAYQKSEKRQYLSDSTRVEPLNVHRTVFHTVVESATHAEAADDEEERDERTQRFHCGAQPS